MSNTQAPTTNPFLFLSEKLLILILCFHFQAFTQSDFPQEQLNASNSFIQNQEFEKGIALGEGIIQYYADQQLKTDTILARNFRNLAHAHSELSDYDQELQYNQRALEAYTKIFGPNHIQVAITYERISASYVHLGQLQQVKESSEKAIALFQALQENNHLSYADAILNLGTYYLYSGDAEEGVNYYQKALAVLIQKLGPDDPFLSPQYYNLGNAYLGLNNWEEALKYTREAFRLDSLLGNAFYMADDLDNIGLIYYQKGDYSKALRTFNRAIQLYLKDPDIQPDYLAHAYNLKGDIYFKLDQYENALQFYQKALKINEQIYGQYHFEISDLFVNLGNCFAAKGLFEEALPYYEKALKAILYYPDEELLFNQVVSPNYLFIILRSRANTEFKYFQSTQRTELLQQAIATYDQAIELIDFVMNNFRGEESMLNLMDEASQLFENAIEAHFSSYEQSKQRSDLEKIYRLAEKNKSVLLLKNLTETKAEKYAGIPDDLLTKEQSLESEITELEATISELKVENLETLDAATAEQLAELNSKRFDLKNQFYALIEGFEKDYPSYFNAKYQLQVPTVPQIQQGLSAEEALVEYVVGEAHLYTIVVKVDDLKVYKQPMNFELNKRVIDLRRGIYGNRSTPRESEGGSSGINYQDQYKKAAVDLFGKLIQPLQKDELPEKLIIVPDGILGYVPFDALLTELPKAKTLYRDYAFLIKDYQISYNYSGALWKTMQEQQHDRTTESFLGIAPSFGNEESEDRYVASRSELGPLRFNIPEVESIQSILGKGMILTGGEGTKENFKKYAERYRILHLSTHGQSNDRVGDECFLAFSENENSHVQDDHFLYVRELYNMRLKADMVVLSACETGIGEIKKGEGIVSLARGFSYAGAKSIIMTLWNVNDAQAKRIMENLYRQLKLGKTKDAALRAAKLDLINNSPNAKAHPYYWAAYVSLGDRSSLDFGAFYSTMFWILGGGIVIVALLVTYFRLKRNARQLWHIE